MGAKSLLNGVDGWRKETRKKKLFSLRQFYTRYEQKFSNLRQLFPVLFLQVLRKSKRVAHWTLGSGGKRPLKAVSNTNTKKVLLSKAKCAHKTNFFFCAAILHPLLVKVFPPETTFFITFPQGFQIFKNFGHLTMGNGG